MSKVYVPTSRHPLEYIPKQLNLSKLDICRALNIALETWQGYIRDHSVMPLKSLYILCGLFGITAEELVYLLRRMKPKDADKWFIESIRQKHGE